MTIVGDTGPQQRQGAGSPQAGMSWAGSAQAGGGQMGGGQMGASAQQGQQQGQGAAPRQIIDLASI